MGSQALPTVILTHGGWHSPKHYHALVPELQSYGYKCICPDLPSVGSEPPTTSLQPDVDIIRKLVQEACDRGEDVVMVAHSWSGAPMGTALDSLSRVERQEQGLQGGVTKLVFMCAFMLPVGMSVWEACGGSAPEWWIFGGANHETIMPENPYLRFYSDMPSEEADRYIAMLRPHSAASLHFKATSAAFMYIPTVYVLCKKDEMLPFQHRMVKMAQEAGAKYLETVTIDAGHSPFLSKVDDTVAVIRRAAGEIR